MDRPPGPAAARASQLVAVPQVQRQATSARRWIGKGNSLKALGTFETHKQAIHAYDKAIEFAHQNLDAWNIWLSNALTLFGESNRHYEEALKSYNMAIDINPIDGMVWSNERQCPAFAWKNKRSKCSTH